ncbi:hypothetical protein [Amycolatopsis sp. PS_44_ISF1]|uniref:hypothetical protein n=1 Tax=Amycolatopsis sp. PS_44_ISF1 TaxID=2974917 RepID=UPI0028E03AF6|nr:hypothetical protein [Amycolatopsis sp. PS_44_ISF1]MDT8914913.1 hypothetical protein [Amycolatopsis sp. PS_44_ISF1]
MSEQETRGLSTADLASTGHEGGVDRAVTSGVDTPGRLDGGPGAPVGGTGSQAESAAHPGAAEPGYADHTDHADRADRATDEDRADRGLDEDTDRSGRAVADRTDHSDRSDRTAAERAGGGEEDAPQLFEPDAVTSFRSRWQEVQTGFVDDPRRAVGDADELVAAVISALASSFAEHKGDLEAQWRHGEPATEDLRIALRRYRSFFDQLLGR